MKVEVIKYQPLHAYELFERQIEEANFFLTSAGDWEAAAKRWAVAGPAFTLTIDGAVEACGGIAMMDESFGECWVFIPSASRGVIVYRHILRKFRELIAAHKFRRLQAFILCDFEKGAQLVERLGFSGRHRLRKYGPGGEDLYLYERVF